MTALFLGLHHAGTERPTASARAGPVLALRAWSSGRLNRRIGPIVLAESFAPCLVAAVVLPPRPAAPDKTPANASQYERLLRRTNRKGPGPEW
jgi:hypothetical protein